MTLAHAYGVPEAISIAIPLAIFVLLIRAGRKRQEREEAERTESAGGPEDATPPPAPPP